METCCACVCVRGWTAQGWAAAGHGRRLLAGARRCPWRAGLKACGCPPALCALPPHARCPTRGCPAALPAPQPAAAPAPLPCSVPSPASPCAASPMPRPPPRPPLPTARPASAPPALALPAGVSSHACKACTARAAATPGHIGMAALAALAAMAALAATQGRHGSAGSCSHPGQARQRWLLQPLRAGTASRRRQPRLAGTQHGVSMGEVVLNNTSWGCLFLKVDRRRAAQLRRR